MSLNIKKVNAVPVVDGSGKYPVDTLFFVASQTAGLVDIYLSSSDGAELKHVSTQDETISKAIIFSETAPALPSTSKFWFDEVTFTLYVQYNDGVSAQWVEAIPSYVVPEFAGTGTANTMARSDHNHDTTYLSIGALEW